MPKQPTGAILIAGPTAGGKSAVAMALAAEIGGVIINADSMQVYRELRELTARPSAEDEAAIRHRLYGVIPVTQAYSVGQWLEDVAREVEAVGREGRVPIITGGTGLYFKALLEGLAPVPEIPEAVRDRWRAQAKRRGPKSLHALLADRDPEMAERLRPQDSQRIVRALEVIDATGRSLGSWQSMPASPVLEAESTRKIVIAPERLALYARIDARVDRMMGRGALEEVAALMALELDSGLPAMRALGVEALMAHLAGEMERADAISGFKTETRRYAKRQMTWLRSNMITWQWYKEKDSTSFLPKIFSFVDV
jgi:tRNA dimethylallyltransferase